jgi:hypothetical protein
MAAVTTPDTPSAPCPIGQRAVRDETSIDTRDWLADIRREFPRLGVLHVDGWTAVWGWGWRIDASTAFELYDRLREQQRAGDLPYQDRKDPA